MNKGVNFVNSIDGLFDEASKAITGNINNRRAMTLWERLCGTCGHSYVNASLHWSREKVHISLESPPVENCTVGWGSGSGGIRYCEKCKHIECIHIWDCENHYAIGDKYGHHKKVIRHCRICERRILSAEAFVCTPSDAALSLISAVLDETGMPPLGLHGGYGSGFMCELPVAVSHVLDNEGEQAANKYIRSQFGSEGCREAMTFVHKKYG